MNLHKHTCMDCGREYECSEEWMTEGIECAWVSKRRCDHCSQKQATVASPKQGDQTRDDPRRLEQANSRGPAEHENQRENEVVQVNKSAWGLEVMLFFGGIAVLIIPVIGWIAGPIMMLMGIVGFFKNLGSIGQKEEWLRGKCPWCGNIAAAPLKELFVLRCPHCKQRSSVRGKIFEKIG